MTNSEFPKKVWVATRPDGNYAKPPIDQWECVKETSTFFFIKQRSWLGDDAIERVRKTDNATKVFATWSEARDWSVQEAERLLRYHREWTKRAEDNLAMLKAAEPPKEKCDE